MTTLGLRQRGDPSSKGHTNREFLWVEGLTYLTHIKLRDEKPYFFNGHIKSKSDSNLQEKPNNCLVQAKY